MNAVTSSTHQKRNSWLNMPNLAVGAMPANPYLSEIAFARDTLDAAVRVADANYKTAFEKRTTAVIDRSIAIVRLATKQAQVLQIAYERVIALTSLDANAVAAKLAAPGYVSDLRSIFQRLERQEEALMSLRPRSSWAISPALTAARDPLAPGAVATSDEEKKKLLGWGLAGAVLLYLAFRR